MSTMAEKPKKKAKSANPPKKRESTKPTKRSRPSDLSSVPNGVASTAKRERRSVLNKDPLSLKAVSAPHKRKSPEPDVPDASQTVQPQANDVQDASTSQAKVPTRTTKRQRAVLPVPDGRNISGRVFVIGENDVGQLGFGEEVDQKTRPAELQLTDDIVDIAAGGMHSVCLTSNGRVITFGCNDEGALGRLTNDESPEHVPGEVDIPEKIVQISAADSHTAALSDTGHVYLWGNFRTGEGPIGLTKNGVKQERPIRILQNEKVVMISSGNEHLVCLSEKGIVYSCGAGENGQLGRLSKRSAVKGGRVGLPNLVEPMAVNVIKSGKAVLMDRVWTGCDNTFFREQGSGAIYACGLNNFNHLGLPDSGSVYIPQKVSSFDNREWTYIRGGHHHTITLDNTGKVYSIGRKDYGRLGLGENCEDASEPTLIPTLQDLKCVDASCGNLTSYAVSEDGLAYTWGFGTNSQLGHGNDEDYHIPEAIGGKFQESWKALKISGGGQHTLILACRKASANK